MSLITFLISIAAINIIASVYIYYALKQQKNKTDEIIKNRNLKINELDYEVKKSNKAHEKALDFANKQQDELTKLKKEIEIKDNIINLLKEENKTLKEKKPTIKKGDEYDFSY